MAVPKIIALCQHGQLSRHGKTKQNTRVSRIEQAGSRPSVAGQGVGTACFGFEACGF